MKIFNLIGSCTKESRTLKKLLLTIAFLIGILGSGCSLDGGGEDQVKEVEESPNEINENTRNLEVEPDQNKTFEIPEVNPEFGDEENSNNTGTFEIPKVDPNF